MAIKYNYPHAFFLSIGIALFLFGLSVFYINDYVFASIGLGKLITHGVSLIIGVWGIFRGFKLWSEKDKEKKEFADLSRKRILLELEKAQLELEDFKDKRQRDQLKREIEALESSKGKNKEEIEKKNEQLKKLNEEVRKKQEEMQKATENIYKLQKEEVSKIPDKYFLPTSWASSPNLSGSNLLPSFLKSQYENYDGLGIINTGSPIPTSVYKTCSLCKSPFVGLPSTDKCPACQRASLKKSNL